LAFVGMGALHTAVGVHSGDSASTSLGGTAARCGAGAPALGVHIGQPAGVVAIDSTGSIVAVTSFFSCEASNATEGNANADATGTRLSATTARNGAGGEVWVVPAVHDAIHGAAAISARLCLGKRSTGNAAVGGGHILIADASLATGAASHRAKTPCVPIANGAVNGARALVARGVVVSEGTGSTTVRCVSDNLAVAVRGASVAGGVAPAPGAPVAHIAVDSAVLGAASAHFSKKGAYIAIVGDIDNNLTGVSFGASATSHGARSPKFPIANFAVHGAWAIVATACFPGDRASSAAVSLGGASVNGTVAEPRPFGATAGSAVAPAAPAVHHAVDRAGRFFAQFVPQEIVTSRAGDTTVRHGSGNRPGLRFASCATGNAAGADVGPVGVYAINRAGLLFTAARPAQTTAGKASPLGGGFDACARIEVYVVASSSRRVASVVGVKKPAMLAFYNSHGVDPPGPGLAIRVRFAQSDAVSLGKRVVVRADVRAPAASV